jgi:hypothetical protein
MQLVAFYAIDKAFHISVSVNMQRETKAHESYRKNPEIEGPTPK